MAKTLQCLICFTVILTAARTERSHFFYTRNDGGVNATELASEEPKSLNLSQLVSEDLSARSQETIRHKRESGDLKAIDLSKLIKIPKECLKQGYCEHIPNYPTKIIDKLLQDLDDSVDFEMNLLNDDLLYEGLHKFSPIKDKDLCDYKTEIVYPLNVEDSDGDWPIVYKNMHKPRQGVRVEICTNPGSPCKNDNISIEQGYKGICKQYKSNRTMVVIKNGKLQQIQTEMPTACHCGVSTNNNVLDYEYD